MSVQRQGEGRAKEKESVPFDDGMADGNLAVLEVVTDVKLHPLGVVLGQCLDGVDLLEGSGDVRHVDECGCD